MGHRRLLVPLVAAMVVAVAGTGALWARQDGRGQAGTPTTVISTTSSTAPPSSSTSAAPTTTTTEAPVVWPEGVRDGTARGVVTPTGVVLAVSSRLDEGSFVAVSPCGREVTVTGEPLHGATVVLDPGHGGIEPGAIGPSGLQEKDVNLAIAFEAQAILEAQGADVVLTRTGDYRITLAARGAITQALQPVAFVSIHHNADPDELRDTPGSETYFQIASPESRRLAGLLYEELFQALSTFDITWAADLDAGAKYRPDSRGGDYYGILKRTAGVPAVLSEAAFIANPPEEALLADPAFQRVEAEAIARAVVRFATTDDPGSGFVEPYPRVQPAGSGGGASGCEDPPLQ